MVSEGVACEQSCVWAWNLEPWEVPLDFRGRSKGGTAHGTFFFEESIVLTKDHSAYEPGRGSFALAARRITECGEIPQA